MRETHYRAKSLRYGVSGGCATGDSDHAGGRDAGAVSVRLQVITIYYSLYYCRQLAIATLQVFLPSAVDICVTGIETCCCNNRTLQLPLRMRQLTLHIPDAVDLDDREVIMLLATRLYENGRLSLGQAAEFAGVTTRAFAELLGAYNVPLFNYPVSDLRKDVMNA